MLSAHLCPECGAALPADAGPMRVLCSGRCRVRRHRRQKAERLARDAARFRDFASLVEETGTPEQRAALAALSSGALGDVMAQALRAGQDAATGTRPRLP